MSKAVLPDNEIHLRPIRLDDVTDSYCRWLNDSQVSRYMETRFCPQSKEDVEAFVQAKIDSQDEWLFAICDHSSGRHLGNTKIGPVNRHHRHGGIILFIGEHDYWGKGVAGEAVVLACRSAFDQLGSHKVNAGIYSNNFGSRPAFEKCGFLREGCRKERFISEGEWVDQVLVGLTNAAFRANQG